MSRGTEYAFIQQEKVTVRSLRRKNLLTRNLYKQIPHSLYHVNIFNVNFYIFFIPVLNILEIYTQFLLLLFPKLPLCTVQGSNSGGGEIFRTCPNQPWGPPSLLYNAYRVFSEGRKRPRRDADPSPTSSAEV
jgi:hypothetical protein